MADNQQALADERAKLDAFWIRAQPFRKYLDDPDVNEITVNEPKVIWLSKGSVKERVDDDKITLDLLKAIGLRLANYKGEPFDATHTSLSTKLPTGERVEMTHPPTCPEDQRPLNIRKHIGVAIPHERLIQSGYYAHTKHSFSHKLTDAQREQYAKELTDEERELWALAQAENFAQFMPLAVRTYQNIIISGATYSGKTSYMRSLVEMIDRNDRIITVEDTPEITLPNHPNHQHLFYKKAAKAHGATAKEVLEMIMRKSPERVLLAELRGNEAMYYLNGVLNSGHPGGMTTTHSGSPKEAFGRIAGLVMQSEDGKTLDMQTILMMLYSAVNVVVQLKFDKILGRGIPGIYYDPMYRYSLIG
jgi:type IV secretion system protein VirB11